MSTDLLWTVLLQGGAEISFRGQGTIQYHDGRQSIWKIRGTRQAVDEVMATARGVGCKVSLYEESQTEEQEEIRLRLLDLGQDFVFHCEQCPDCHWFDPLTEKNCGLMDWPDETVDASATLHEKARLDRDSCPVNRLPIEQTK